MGHDHHQPVVDEGDRAEERYREIRFVTLVGSAIDLGLGIAKIIGGYIGSSAALIADGVHSLSDLATDGLVLFAAKHGSREADDKHPYGHGRIETLGTVVLGVILIAVAIGIGYDATLRIMHPELRLHPGWLVLVIAIISIVSKEWIYRYTLRTAEKYKSNLLRANAWHSRSDAISSFIVVIGVIGSMAGLDYLDAVAAIGVAIMVAKIGGELTWDSTKELIDTAMDPEDIEQIQQAIESIEDVKALHMLRTRRMGSDGLVDVHVLVKPKISVSEGHRVSEAVRAQIIRNVDAVTDVMVHIDPEDDEVVAPCTGLPLRSDVLKALNKRWEDVKTAQYIEETVLHYLDGKIHVEVLLPLERMGDISDTQAIAKKLKELAEEEDCIADVQVRFY